MYFIFRDYVCSRRYPAFNGHVPHYNFICCLSGFIIFSTLSKNDTIYGKTLLNTKLCFDFIYNFETYLILRIVHRIIIIKLYRSSCKTPAIIVRF